MIGRVAIFTRNEADYHLLFPLIREVQDHDTLALQLLVGGEHLSRAYGRTVAMIQADGIPINRLLPVPMKEDMSLDGDQLRPATAVQIRRVIDELGPDLLLLVGGDSGAEGALEAAREKGVPFLMVHHCEGRAPDCRNHLLAQAAALHFVPSDVEAAFLRDCGVEPDKLAIVGALESDLARIPGAGVTDRTRLEQELDLPAGQPLVLAAWQPDREGWEKCQQALGSMLASFDQLPRSSILFLGDRADPERLRLEVDAFIARNAARARLFVSPGRRRALSLLRMADVIVGNSDLGALEASSIGTPSVRVGTAGLAAGSCFIPDDSGDPDSIVAAIREALAAASAPAAIKTACPTADYRVASRIVQRLEDLIAGARASSPA